MRHMIWARRYGAYGKYDMVHIKSLHSSSMVKNRGAPGFRCMLHDLSLVDLKGTTLIIYFVDDTF